MLHRSCIKKQANHIASLLGAASSKFNGFKRLTISGILLDI
jgi:hypothetical protein